MGIKTNMKVTTPTGVIETMAGNNASLPAGYAICNGQELSKALYPQLFAVLGVTYGLPVNPLNFVLPDLRGLFVRGLDSGRGVDAGRTLASIQVDGFKEHNHTYSRYGASSLTSDGASHFYGLSGADTSATGGSETRPKNNTTIYIIKL